MMSPSYSHSNTSYRGIRYGVSEFPLWMGAGHTLGFSGLGSPKNIAFSVIEFNVIL